MSRRWRALCVLGWPLVVASCNSLFGVEEPHLASEGQGGDSAGPGGSAGAAAGEGGENPGGTDGAGGAFGGSDGGSFGGSAGAGAGEHVGGSAGELDIPGGAPNASGGAGTITSGAAGEATSSGGAGGTGGTGAVAGVAGTGGVAPCIDEQSSCADATQVKRCEAGQWVFDDCEYGCRLNECSECEPGTIECQGTSALRQCDQNGYYEPVESCGDQFCTTLGCRDCVPGSSRCNSVSGDAETCTGGTWVLANECEPQEEICEISGGLSECVENRLRDYGPGEAFDELTDVAPNVLRVFPLGELKVTSRLVYFALFGDGEPGAVARFVLYADQSGRPGPIVASSYDVGINDMGPNTGSPRRATVLQAGTSYWIGAVFAPAGEPKLRFRSNDLAPPGYELELSFGTGFPTEFPTDAREIFNAEMNLFLQIRTETPP
jgi:hypothetical protein